MLILHILNMRRISAGMADYLFVFAENLFAMCVAYDDYAVKHCARKPYTRPAITFRYSCQLLDSKPPQSKREKISIDAHICMAAKYHIDLSEGRV